MTHLRLPTEIRDTRAPLLGTAVACVLAVTFFGSMWVHGCRMEGEDHIDCVDDCSPANEALESCREHLGEHEAFDVQSEHESALIAADLAGYERCMYADTNVAVLRSELKTDTDAVNDRQGSSHTRTPVTESPARLSTSQKISPRPTGWPKVLSIFGHRLIDEPGADPKYKIDIHATEDALIKLPPLGDDLRPRFDASKSEYVNRAVTEFDMVVASRDHPIGSMVEVCQDGGCSPPVIVGDFGPNGALCDDPSDCGKRCVKRTEDVSRPGWVGVAYWTVLRWLGPSCSFRGLVDITWAVCRTFDCSPMEPATVTRLRRTP